MFRPNPSFSTWSLLGKEEAQKAIHISISSDTKFRLDLKYLKSFTKLLRSGIWIASNQLRGYLVLSAITGAAWQAAFMLAVISSQRVGINNKLLPIVYPKCLPKVVINFHFSWVYHHADVPAVPMNSAPLLNYFPQADNILWFLTWRKLRILRGPASSLMLIWRTTVKKKIAGLLLDCFLFLADSSLVPGHSSYWTGWTSLKWSWNVWAAQEPCASFSKISQTAFTQWSGWIAISVRFCI